MSHFHYIVFILHTLYCFILTEQANLSFIQVKQFANNLLFKLNY